MKVQKRWKYRLYIHLLLFFIAVVIVFPLLLQCPWINEQMSRFVSGLEHAQYKEAYIGVWGGIIGSILGVLGAVMVQGVADNHQQSVNAKQSATVVYYDLFLFYKEISPFASAFLTNTDWNKKNIGQLMQLKRPIIISNDWIHDVASLNGVFTQDDWIHEVYKFYGAVVTIQHFTASANNVLHNRAELEKLLRLIGSMRDKKEYTWYRCLPLQDQEHINLSPILAELEQFIGISKS